MVDSVTVRKYFETKSQGPCHIVVKYMTIGFGEVLLKEEGYTLNEEKSAIFTYNKELLRFFKLLIRVFEALNSKKSDEGIVFLQDGSIKIDIDTTKDIFLSILKKCASDKWNTVLQFSVKKELINFINVLNEIFLCGVWVKKWPHKVINTFLSCLTKKGIGKRPEATSS